MSRDPAGASCPVQQPEINFLLSQIQVAADTHFDGNLCLSWGNSAPWGLTFRHGRLAWAWASNYRLRRWRRLLGPEQAHTVAQSPQQGFASTTPVWEYETLKALVATGRMEREDGLAIMRQNFIEVLFDLVQLLYTTGRLPQISSQPFKLEQPLKFFSPGELFVDVSRSWSDWSQAQLQGYSPMAAPCLHQPEKLKALVSEASYQNLNQLLQGQYALRELSTLMDQNLLTITQTLVSYERRCLIKFTRLPQPLKTGKTLNQDPSPTRTPAQPVPLVMCIDDSDIICQRLGKIVTEAGYRYEAVRNPLEALQRVLETQPSLIFLDLVMPIISGYELCSQIRRVSGLRKIPIVVLTSNDGVIDRVRLKVAGSNDFLSKPICPEEIQKALEQHCVPATAAVA